jgi:hypothetical protein
MITCALQIKVNFIAYNFRNPWTDCRGIRFVSVYTLSLRQTIEDYSSLLFTFQEMCRVSVDSTYYYAYVVRGSDANQLYHSVLFMNNL